MMAENGSSQEKKPDYYALSLKLHEENRGKISVISKVPVNDRLSLSTAYTPGVAEPCRRIAATPSDIYRYTSKGNLVAVVTDGTAVLGLGDIGADASLPVMEGKCVLFKEFGGVDAFPIAIASKDVDEIVRTVKLISSAFGGINLEDISAPRCFEVERRLKKELDIPVFHDDQHGTAVVVLAGLTNALKLAEKRFEDVRVVVSGAGAAGIAVTRLLLSRGVRDVILADRTGAIYEGRAEGMNPEKEEMARLTNPRKARGSLAEVMKGADVFIGVSAPKLVTSEMVRSMAPKSVVFAMANPTPEIMPELARDAGAFVVATGRSDFPNQVNNVLAFPGIFRGALDARARDINESMKVAAAEALASAVAEPSPDNVIPNPFTPGLAKRVAEAVRLAAVESGVARV